MTTRYTIVTAIMLTTAVASGAATKPRAYTLKAPPVGVKSPFYVSNRAPLIQNPLIKLPIGSIRPEGWLRTQLKLTANGYTGRLTEISPWCKIQGNAWVSPTGQGANGWEEVPYWLKGFGDLGYVLGDRRIITEAKRWMDGVIASQEADGYFGPRANKQKPDLWPNMPMLDALQSYYDYSGDRRVLTLMKRYFRWQLDEPRKDILPGYWDKMRGGDNMESIYWLYNRTGDPWLLQAAKRIQDCTAKWADGVVNWHGVNIAQGFREPAIWYQQSHDPKHLAAAERNYQTVRAAYGQVPGGMYGADENARRGYTDPRQGTETCSFVEMMHSDQLLIGISGNPIIADRCEDVAFNSFPASQTADMRGLHYLTAPNQPQLDRESKSPGIENGGDMFSYNPNDYRCCQHNVAMGWPYYAEHLWMATQDRGLAAILYSASSVTAKVGPGRGTRVTIMQATDYPFSSRVTLTVNPKAPVSFPLYLRIPGWTEGARITVNGRATNVRPEPGSYAVVERTWKPGDRVALTLPMRVSVHQWTQNKDSVSVNYGPLTFSLKIGEKSVPYGKKPWVGHEVFPTTPWNYGLELNGANPAASLTVKKKAGPLAAQPFTLAAAPFTITAKGRRIPNWGMHKGLADVLQQSPVRTDEPLEKLTLVPMGCARLRVSAFPVVGDGPDAREWAQRPAFHHDASHESDDLNAPTDGILPANSADETVPRFTWWDHRGTEEWITWNFQAPRLASSTSVYWFDDRGKGGSCAVPASWQVFYRDGAEWKPVSNASAAGTEKDRFNAVTFDPVTTTGLKIVARFQPNLSAGILEWKAE
ncbi:MAG TPA: beta-L-arabinofuranosidase domain-containing protein [Armatimonadota bacterium]